MAPTQMLGKFGESDRCKGLAMSENARRRSLGTIMESLGRGLWIVVEVAAGMKDFVIGH